MTWPASENAVSKTHPYSRQIKEFLRDGVFGGGHGSAYEKRVVPIPASITQKNGTFLATKLSSGWRISLGRTQQGSFVFQATQLQLSRAAQKSCCLPSSSGWCCKAMSGLSLCCSLRIVSSLGCVSIRYSVRSHKYCKVQAREASSVGSCINTSDLYKSVGLHPHC